MKTFTIIFLILGFNTGFSQVEVPLFEQIAFDFYKDTILEKHPSEKKIRIAKYAVDLYPNHSRFQVGECLIGEFLDEKTNLEVLSYYAEKQTDFDFYSRLMNYDGINKKQFRIKKSKTESYPYLRISMPYHKKDVIDGLFVTISEYHKKKEIIYYLLLDRNGVIKNWCQNVQKSTELITIY